MLKAIEWSGSLSCRNQEIDDDHKNLIRYYNNFFAACFSGVGAEVINETLSQVRVIHYTKYHFQREESLMLQHAYSGLAVQKKEHETFLRAILELREKVASGTGTRDRSLINDSLAYFESLADDPFDGVG